MIWQGQVGLQWVDTLKELRSLLLF